MPDGECGEITCAATDPCPGPGPGPGPAPVIPVTAEAAGGPKEELVIIPVTGIDLGCELVGLQQLFLYAGMMLFGVTMVLEGLSRKIKL